MGTPEGGDRRCTHTLGSVTCSKATENANCKGFDDGVSVDKNTLISHISVPAQY